MYIVFDSYADLEVMFRTHIYRVHNPLELNLRHLVFLFEFERAIKLVTYMVLWPGIMSST